MKDNEINPELTYAHQSAPLWWERPGLRYINGHLHLGEQNLEHLARAGGTPMFAYHAPRVLENLKRLRTALDKTRLTHRQFYAVKANRFPPLLTHLRLHGGGCGIDACSPREIAHVLQCGFREEDISFTATSVSNRDLDALARWPGVYVNCDSLSVLRRLGERMPGREIGLRINPRVGIGYGEHEKLQYSGEERITKFGIYEEHFDEALALARRYDLRITGLHFHVGYGYQTHHLPGLERALRFATALLDRLPQARRINVGGGLGVRVAQEDTGLDLNAWAAALDRHLGGRPGLTVCVEPGNFLVRDAGVLLLEVNTVERKAGKLFVGVDGGYNIQIEPSLFHVPSEPVLVRERSEDEPRLLTTIAGNINEAMDLLAEDVLLPAIEEGEILALLNGGAYGSSMVSDHCMRGQISEYLIGS